jgi:two-component system sensor histidine kinase CiaH
MKMRTHYLKRFGEWVTGLTDSYRFNPFVQATVHIIAIMVILAALLITISGWVIQYAQNNTVGSISYHLQEAVHGSSDGAATLPKDIADVRDRTLAFVFAGLIALIVLFGYLLIRFALSPAKDSLQLQKRFIGNVAHEIRTPLSIIKTSTEVYLLDPTIRQDMRETLEGTILELDRISEIINNLLSFNTLMQPGRIKTEPVDLGLIVETVLGRHEALAKSRGVTLSSTIGKNRMVLGNTMGLEQVVTNLVKNAINYTPEGKDGAVIVNVENDFRGRVVLAVIDSGVGIAQKDLYHVFEPFYRGDTSRARVAGTGSSGLGLAIVNEIVRLHRGIISIKSAVGRGTTIAISLPPVPFGKLENPLTTSSDESLDEGIHEVSVDFS